MSILTSQIAGTLWMAASVMQVLHIIGWVLLILLFIVIALILCVLFWPICYQVAGDSEQMQFSAKIHWLLHIVSFRFYVDQKGKDYALYLFGIRTKLLEDEAIERRRIKSERRKAKKAAKIRRSRKKKYQKQHDKYKEEYERLQMEVSGDVAGRESIAESAGTDIQGRTAAVSGDFEDFTKEDRKIFGDGTDAIEPGKQDAMKRVLATLKKVAHVLHMLQEHRPMQAIWPDVQRLLYRARPRHLEGKFQYGLSDPSQTGQILGALSCVSFLYQFPEFQIYPDFDAEKNYVEAHGRARGHLQGIYGIAFAIRIFRKKQFRRFMDSLKL